jgi:hypothetical protein
MGDSPDSDSPELPSHFSTEDLALEKTTISSF